MLKRLVYTLPDLSPSKLVEHKKSGLISYFGVPSDRGMKPINFLAATEDYRVLHKIILRGWRDYELTYKIKVV